MRDHKVGIWVGEELDCLFFTHQHRMDLELWQPKNSWRSGATLQKEGGGPKEGRISMTICVGDLKSSDLV